MVYLEAVIIVDFVIFIFIASMGVDLEDDERRQSLRGLNSKSSFSSISRSENPLEIGFGFDMPKYTLWAKFNFFANLALELAFKGSDFILSSVPYILFFFFPMWAKMGT